ncbi:hypothetical protein AWRI1631_51680 [Saccharomyces cerevisiae AWRI1631]|uniref:Uncharacterized protein n=1 Tax=Saccharomyces cerevisiae (strain AWRI1631) TaxID=545124 RepID=B5VHM9_YEAS6|nr:hypothetical protein AWRI1631_51680 [Saccharomyces cerevisiae AWRI1631]
MKLYLLVVQQEFQKYKNWFLIFSMVKNQTVRLTLMRPSLMVLPYRLPS